MGRKKSLMTKAAIAVLILILPFNIVGIFTSVHSYRNSVKNAQAAISFTLESHSILLNNKIRNTNTALYELSNTNVLLLNLCSSQNDSDYMIARNRLFQDLSDQMVISDIAETLFLYLPEHDDYIKVPAFTGANAGTRPYIEYIESYDYTSAHWFLSADGTELLRILYDQSLHLYFGASIDLSAFLSGLENVKEFPSLQYSFQTAAPVPVRGQLSFCHRISDGVYLCAMLSSNELNGSISFLQYALIIVFILYLALIPCLFLMMKRYVGNPLRALNDAHTQLRKGNEDYRITAHSNSSEFENAYESFNRMASSLQQLQREVLEKELANKQLQIDYLQLQIRPHFLLNSFNVLYTLIQRGQKEPSQEMVLFLSDYFRYLFRSGNELQLFSMERKLIEDYMKITKIYYPDSFEVSYQLDPSLDQMRVPPLLLHSFMENIIAHALLPQRMVHIVFFGEYESGIVTFIISDDGKGIDPGSLYAINHVTEQSTQDGKNVGIKNSILRLKYYYGENANVECDSQEHVGTTFTITIPYNLEEV